MNITIKKFEDYNVRVFSINDEPWFVASDILKALKSTTKITDLKYSIGLEKFNIPDSIGRKQKVHLINEKGLYQLLASTRKASISQKETLVKILLNNKTPSKIYTCNLNKETEFIYLLEQTLKPFNIKGIKQYSILDYKIDFYLPELCIGIEYDESYHKYQNKKDKERELLISKQLNCEFIRVSDRDTNGWNVGYIIKQLIEKEKLIIK